MAIPRLWIIKNVATHGAVEGLAVAPNEMLFDIPNPRQPQPGTAHVPHSVESVERAGQPLMLLLIHDTTIPRVMVVLGFVVAVLPCAATWPARYYPREGGFAPRTETIAALLSRSKGLESSCS